MGHTSSKELNHDIDRRGMAQYYSQLSVLYYSNKPHSIDLKNVLKLSMQPSSKMIKYLVGKNKLKNRHYLIQTDLSDTVDWKQKFALSKD
jgi:hypothetical protein